MAVMPRSENFNIISLKFLSEKSGVSYQRMYHSLAHGRYNSLTDVEKTKISTALFEEVSKAFIELGFKISIKRTR